jgi:hypothetical protein
MPITGLRFPNGAQCTTKYLTPYSPPNTVARQAREDAQTGPIRATRPRELAIDRGDTESVLYGGPGQWIEGAVDGGPGDVGEAEVVVAGVGPQPGEGLGQLDLGAF